LALLGDVCEMGIVEHADELYEEIKRIASE
jgi:hypothetical protein